MLKVPEQYVGRNGHCNHCGGAVTIMAGPVFASPSEVWHLSDVLSYAQRNEALRAEAGVGHAEAVSRLLEAGASHQAMDKFGMRALHEAAGCGHLDVVKVLIESGALINAVTYDGCTALHYAAGRGHVEVVRYLVEQGADVSARDREGKTPLHFAASSNRDRARTLEVIQILIEHGAHVHERDKHGETAVHDASELGFHEVAEFLRRCEAATH